MERGNSKLGYFISSFIGILVGAGLLFAIVQYSPFVKGTVTEKNLNPKTSVIQQPVIRKTGTSTISIVAKNLMPAVVGVTSTINSTATSKGGSVVGSGIIVDKKAYILTNNHVANKQANDITVSLFDGRDLKGKVVWSDEGLDLAVLKISGDNLTVAPLGDSKILTVGDTAIAIGNPLGLTFQRTVTSGIISAINRTIGEPGGLFMEDLLQTDASINPGNSGGPLININSEVIGINTVKVTSAEGMGFAIPINIVKPILKSIKEKGNFVTPIIGIQGIDKQMAGFVSDIKVQKGIYVYEVKSGSPAELQGIKKGDIILSVNGTSVNTMVEFRSNLYSIGVGNSVTLKIKGSNNKEKNINIKLVGAAD
ncbi:trypsin-like peptidase domain-containing protein [Clostridium algoriphilum]|uniref:S1C family serine protease n=1 Tax=Clostridium algoriphilum TaxID=198347 RepID=UPI001CF4B666|nr:trypsin-like peptidase domain-containing protein [Clostridium algoriphilum]MCB2294985.1 trypsin-like peptidase domain-containing protein [Clostridium algoriphilum]